MTSPLIRVLIMIIVYFFGMIIGGFLVCSLEALMIGAGDMIIYVRKGDNWVKLFDPDAEVIN